MYWNEHIECMPKEQLKKLQGQRLQDTVYRVYQNVPFYRKKMQEAGLAPENIKSIEDINKLPFTTKADLRDNYPYGLFASPMSEIIRIHASSGTTGKPTVVGYTRNDITNWSEVAARALVCAGGNSHSVVQVAYGYGLFTGGLGMHYGVEKLGGSVIPISGGNTKRQIMIMKDFGSTIICCTPSYALYIAEVMQEMGVAPSELKLQSAILGAEPWSEEMRRDIENKLGIKAFDIYGLSEIIGPGVAMECECQSGAHIFEDYFYPEIINLKTGKPCPDGEEGELVLTTLGKKAMPMIRYRTRDITALTSETCECGRTLRRIKRIGRRADDMFIIRGVNVFPSQIETALLKVEGTLPHYQIVLTRERDLDVMEVQVEVTSEFFTDTVGALEQLQSQLSKSIETTVGVRANVRLVQPHTIQRSEGKAKRVIDQRKM